MTEFKKLGRGHALCVYLVAENIDEASDVHEQPNRAGQDKHDNDGMKD